IVTAENPKFMVIIKGKKDPQAMPDKCALATFHGVHYHDTSDAAAVASARTPSPQAPPELLHQPPQACSERPTSELPTLQPVRGQAMKPGNVLFFARQPCLPCRDVGDNRTKHPLG